MSREDRDLLRFLWQRHARGATMSFKVWRDKLIDEMLAHRAAEVQRRQQEREMQTQARAQTLQRWAQRSHEWHQWHMSQRAHWENETAKAWRSDLDDMLDGANACNLG